MLFFLILVFMAAVVMPFSADNSCIVSNNSINLHEVNLAAKRELLTEGICYLGCLDGDYQVKQYTIMLKCDLITSMKIIASNHTSYNSYFSELYNIEH